MVMKKLFKGRAGFTLIELMVVVAVIAILAAILYPVFAQARDRARQASCVSSLKQIGTAMDLYRQDYDQSFPTNEYLVSGEVPADDVNAIDGKRPYYVQLNPYIKNYNLFVCASRGKGQFGHWHPSKALQHEERESCHIGNYPRRLGAEPNFFGRVSYGFNQALWGAREVEVVNSTRLPMLFDCDTIFPILGNATDPTGGVRTPAEIAATHQGRVGALGMQASAGVCYPLHWNRYGAVMRHMDGLNVLFADGHVKYVPWREMHQPRYCLLPEHP
jgi:prepilin-type N-terminal cleavage/methylation domain-containing protein/prepilin-type processing-associated H-X9-DG protein